MPEKKLTAKEKLMQRVGALLPANWVQLDGMFSPSELRTLADEVEKNFKKVRTNGISK